MHNRTLETLRQESEAQPTTEAHRH